MNRLQKKTQAENEKKKSKPGARYSRARKYLRLFGMFGMVSTENILRSMPFILFLTIIAILYIANNYMAERTIRDIDAVTKELKTLRSEHISQKSELMFRSKQSEVARLVEPYGIKESVEAPRKIIVNKTEQEMDN